jgi:hypothetical protein
LLGLETGEHLGRARRDREKPRLDLFDRRAPDQLLLERLRKASAAEQFVSWARPRGN